MPSLARKNVCGNKEKIELRAKSLFLNVSVKESGRTEQAQDRIETMNKKRSIDSTSKHCVGKVSQRLN